MYLLTSITHLKQVDFAVSDCFFIRDNFEHAGENFTTQLTLWYFVSKIVWTLCEKFVEITRTIYSNSESSKLVF